MGLQYSIVFGKYIINVLLINQYIKWVIYLSVLTVVMAGMAMV